MAQLDKAAERYWARLKSGVCKYVECASKAMPHHARCKAHLNYDADWHFVMRREDHDVTIECSACEAVGHNKIRCGRLVASIGEALANLRAAFAAPARNFGRAVTPIRRPRYRPVMQAAARRRQAHRKAA